MLAVVEHHRWGSTLSPKFFLEKRFVVKHVRTKHAERLAEEQSKIQDELYWWAFQSTMEAERKQAKLAEKKAMMQHGGHAGHMMMGGHDMHMMMGGPPPDMEGGVYEHYPGDEMMEGAAAGGFMDAGGVLLPPGPAPPPGGPRPPPRAGGGRGMGGARRPPMMDPGAMVDPAMMLGAMGGMGAPMGPIFIPIAGAGPMGHPILGAPQAFNAAMLGPGPMDMEMAPMMAPFGGPPAGGFRGMGGRGGGRGMMRGRGGGFGGQMMAPPGTKLDPAGYREYYDLDNPRNNRAVLDYGDL
eukprot:jgi/Chrzof1/4061/Cz13g18260.t1